MKYQYYKFAIAPLPWRDPVTKSSFCMLLVLPISDGDSGGSGANMGEPHMQCNALCSCHAVTVSFLHHCIGPLFVYIHKSVFWRTICRCVVEEGWWHLQGPPVIILDPWNWIILWNSYQEIANRLQCKWVFSLNTGSLYTLGIGVCHSTSSSCGPKVKLRQRIWIIEEKTITPFITPLQTCTHTYPWSLNALKYLVKMLRFINEVCSRAFKVAIEVNH